MNSALGMIEYKTVSTGMKACDILAKTTDVELIEAQTICPGKYIVIFYGELSSVKASIDASLKAFPEGLIDSFVLGNPHESLISALSGTTNVKRLNAVGIVETFTGASTIVAADASAKAAKVDMIEIRVARGMCGKSYVTFTGDVAAVEAAVEAGKRTASENGMLLDYAVIPGPDEKFFRMLL